MGQCNVKFTYESPNPLNLFVVQFYDTSDSTINQWFWDFGESSTSSDNKKNPKYTYQNPGTYVVTLIGSDSISNCFKVIRKVIEIPGNYKACRADFNVDSIDFNIFQFRDTSVFSTAGMEKKSWHWDFGDNQFSNFKNPFHTYEKGGEYKVCLKIIDSNANCTDSICKTIFAFTCEANFYAQKDTIGNTFRFFPEFSQGYNPSNVKWIFGDGDSTNSLNPQHTFDTLGSFMVCMYSQNKNICLDTVCQIVTINSINKCEFDFNYIQNKKNLFFSIDTLLEAADQYLWDFGDGSTDSGLMVSHYFANAGNYEICVRSKLNKFNCTKVICKSIDIKKEIILIHKKPGLRNSKIIPNPIAEVSKLEIEVFLGESMKLKVFDVLGKELFTIENIEQKNFFINLPNLANGSYFYHVLAKEELISIGRFQIN